MDWIMKSVLGKGEDESGAESTSSVGDASNSSESVAGEDAAAAESSSRAVAFEVKVEPSTEQHHLGNAGGIMDSMAYLTQPDPMLDDASREDDNNDTVEYDHAEEQKDDTPQKQPKKGKRKLMRARKQSGDFLSQLQSSPEGRQHSHAVRSKSSQEILGKHQPPQPSPSLSQSVAESPLRSPSPLKMSQLNPFSPLDSVTKNERGINDLGADFEDSISPKKSPNVQFKYGISTPSNRTKHAATSDKYEVESIDYGKTQPVIEDEIIDEKELQHQRFLHQMDMKKQAIYRSLLHLSDNSYSFVYDDFNDNQTKSCTINNDDEPGLPFVGPGLEKQYDDLRLLLRKGLLGYTNDDVGEEKSKDDIKDCSEEPSEAKSKIGDIEDVGETAHAEDSSSLLPRIKANVSAVLMGPRGFGKSLVLERCLASLSRLAAIRKKLAIDQMIDTEPVKAEELYSQASFRVVRLNGLLFQGDSAVACTREIARQIGVMSREERKRTKRRKKQMGLKRKGLKLQPSDMETPKTSKRKRKREKNAEKSGQKKLLMASPATPLLMEPKQTPDESHNLRNRQSGFNTYIALLDEVLRTARIDGIPILIVLEELDAFLAGGQSTNLHNVMDSSEGGSLQQDGGGSNDRQLLLYHLLDRVADHKFLVSLVGMTTDLTTVTKLEKRVQSRAEGTSKVIYFSPCPNYDSLVNSLLGKFYTPPEICEPDEDEYNESKAMLDIREEVEIILCGGKSDRNGMNHDEDGQINDFALVQRVLRRNFELSGSDMRWVCRVFDVALGLLASDIDEHMYRSMEKKTGDAKIKGGSDFIPSLSPGHLAQALVSMSASMDDVSSTIGRPGIPSQSTMELIRWGQLLGDSKHYSSSLGTDPRLAALLDLSGPQIAVLLAARRIAARDDTRDGEDEIEARRTKGTVSGSAATMTLPLTYQRIQDEYTTSFVASGRYTISSDRYPPHVLYRSCMDLMEMDIIRFKKEICSGGALQYGHNDALSSGTNISNLPLHINLEWELEFNGALKAGLLQCSTALREWGLKMN